MIARRRLEAREAAALTERHWVRLTRCCNNRCAFCLDADAHDGRPRPAAEVLDDIAEGARLGRRRLVLSGGEPSIHPDFLELLRAGARAGYERTQVITNGRMFARPGAIEAAVEAGLGELTVSVHGHTAELHDRLVGVAGAFAQTLRGLRAALARGRLIVNVDVVICGPNAASFDRVVALCHRLGVRELDLLLVQPAGRAARDPAMLPDPAVVAASLGRVLELARRADLFVWTNRVPAGLLEGHEELIQDPHKLIDEVRGRLEEVERLLAANVPLRCRGDGASLCRACFLAPLCDELHDAAARLARGDVAEVLIDLRDGGGPALPSRLAAGVRRARVLAPSLTAARERLAGPLPGREAAIVIDRRDGLEPGAPLELGGLPVVRVASESPDALDAAAGRGAREIEVAAARACEAWLEAHRDLPGLVVRPAPRETATACLEHDLPPARLAALLARSAAAVEDVPPCLAGGRPVTWTRAPLDPALASGPGREAIERHVARFAAGRFRARSLRCEACIMTGSCRGELVQRLRAFGLRALEPMG